MDVSQYIARTKARTVMETQQLMELIELSKSFNANTKKMFRYCKFAAMNVFSNREDWEVWGDFTNRKQAIDAAYMWSLAFKHKATITIVDNKYRVQVSIWESENSNGDTSILDWNGRQEASGNTWNWLLLLKTNRSIKYTKTLTAAQNPQYVGWRVYKVTDKGLTELEAQYTISRMALLD